MAAAVSSSAEDVISVVLCKLEHVDQLISTEALPNVPFESLKAALDRLASRSMVSYEQVEREEALLELEAQQIVDYGSHEARVFEAVRKAVEGLSLGDLESQISDKNVTKVGMGKAFKEKWIRKDNDKLVALVDSISDVTRDELRVIQKTRTHDKETIASLKKRKLLRMQKSFFFKIAKGSTFALEMVKEETDLTAEMLASGAWKTASFKPYNFNALGADQGGGALHPLNKYRSELRLNFFEMGFTEMPTNQFVESGFWNFDALFVPQQHPARDVQDTFFVSDPAKADRPAREQSSDNDYFDTVKQVHETGLFGSIGYRYPWSEDESLKLVLRTHTTATSASMLRKLALSRGPDGRVPPARYFSIDRVFRNETVDQTHLCEFHQVEGVVADYGLSLGGLMELLGNFFGRMGLTDVKFKPAYNPYTEPSMEVFAFHKGLGRLVEIGNSGMFRAEVLETMGLPRDLRVYGFGLGVERSVCLNLGITNIRDLLGHTVDINFIQKNAAVRLDK